jgi:hypothetical protein
MGELTEREDEWQRRATAAAVAGVRKLTHGKDAVINENMPVGKLNDWQVGWIVAEVLFSWIAVRAEQAASEGLDAERVIRATAYDRAWDAGAIAAILPQLAEASFDWQQPFFTWPRSTMVEFLMEALKLTQTAVIARDFSGRSITRKSSADKLNDPVPSLA